MDPAFMLRRLAVIDRLRNAVERDDDDDYCQAYDDLTALEREAGEFDGDPDEDEEEVTVHVLAAADAHDQLVAEAVAGILPALRGESRQPGNDGDGTPRP